MACVFSTLMFADETLLLQVDADIAAQRYQSAFDRLYKANKTYKDPDLTLKSFHLAMDYYVHTTGHQLFAFRDLDDLKTLDAARQDPELSFTYPLNADRILKRLIKKYPNRADLKEARVRYLLITYLYYGKDWSTYEDVLDTAEQIALPLEKTSNTWYVPLLLAYAAYDQDRVDDAETYMNKARHLAPDNLYVKLIQAHILDVQGYHKKAKKMANEIKDDIHINRRQYASLMALLGRLYAFDKSYAEAQVYYEQSVQLNGADLMVNLELIQVYLYQKMVEKAHPMSLTLLKKYGYMADINKGVVQAYTKTNTRYEIGPLYREAMNSTVRNEALFGVLGISYGRYLCEQADQKVEGVGVLKKAKKALSQIYRSDHPLFGLIEALLLRYDTL